MAIVDSLQIEIIAGVKNAERELDALTVKLKKVSSVLGTTGIASQKNFYKFSNNLSLVNKSFNRSAVSAKSFISSFAKIGLTLRSITGSAKGLKSAIKESVDYLEVLNYYNKAWEQVAEKADLSAFKELGYESAELYADSFSERASELTAKMTGFNIKDDGTLEATGGASLGINPTALMNYQAMFGQMASSIGTTSEQALMLSNALTMIGADLASVKNMDFEKVWHDMASGLAGMSRTLDKYGVNIRNVNLQEKLHELGINANIQSLNQYDKALLRVIILLDSTRYAWGDLSETINQPANQIRLLQANFTNLARTIGNLFLPIVSSVLPYINGLVIALQRLFVWVGSLAGLDLSNITSSVGGGGSNLDDILGTDEAEEGVNNVSGAVKKLKSYLLGIDELNVISPEEETGAGGSLGGIGSGLLDDAFLDAYNEYMKAWEEAFAGLENKANEIADRIVNAFKSGDFEGIGEFIGMSIANALDSIDWQKVYEVTTGFFKGLAEFWNGLISPELFSEIGETIASALNTVIYSQLSFGTNFDFVNLGESIASGINSFFNTFDFGALAKTLNTWVDGLKTTIASMLRTLKWSDILESAGEFLGDLELDTIGVIVGIAMIKKIGAVKIASTVLGTLGKSIGTKLGAAIIGALSFGGIGKVLMNAFPSSTLIQTITTTMAETGATLPAVLGSMILTPIKTFFTVTIPNVVKGAFVTFGSWIPHIAILGAIAEVGSKIVETMKGAFDTSDWNLGDWITNTLQTAWNGIYQQLDMWRVQIEVWWQDTWLYGALWNIGDWFNTYVLPWFTEEKWMELWENVKLGISTKWQEIVDWWNSSALVTWWNTNVSPWFTKERWLLLFDSIKSSLSEIWNNTVVKWRTDITNWWNNNVKPWFTKDRWLGILNNIGTSFSEAFETAKTWVSEKMQAIYDTVSGWISSITSKISEIKNAFTGLGGLTVANAGINIALGTQGFATGGFPNSADIFYANENGVPELVGTIGNRTAVASGTEITGISDAVYSSSQAEMELMREQNNLLRALLEKDTNIVFDTREGLNALRQQESRQGVNFSNGVLFA